jgi:pimeloyl-ACP methyl ester carboxylesterase
MGGWIVQIVASNHSERVNRLMLFDAAGIYAKPNWDTHLFTPNSPAQLDQLEALLMPHPQPIPPFVARDVLRISRNRAWLMNRAMDSMLTGRDVTDNLLPQLKMPVLIAWGAEDRITPVELARKMHNLVPQSQLAVFAGCGHLAAGQCSSQVGRKVVEFVEQ